MPPVLAVIPTLEEITIDSDNSLSGISSDFINKTSNELRLKRTKPLPNHRNTLEKLYEFEIYIILLKKID